MLRDLAILALRLTGTCDSRNPNSASDTVIDDAFSKVAGNS